nr:DUF4367 domain-containing protein [Sedimentibacter sp.]
MDKKEYVADKTIEAMLQAVASDSEGKVVDDILKGFEGQNHEFSQKHEEAILKMFKKDHKSQFYCRIGTYSKRAAVVFFAIIVISVIAISSVSALRARFMNFILEMTQYDTDINFTDNASKADSYKFDEITLEYVPEGFKLEKSELRKNHVYLAFGKEQGYFNFSTMDIGGSLSIDTEEANIKELIINEMDALYSENDNARILVWHDSETSYILTGNISERELIKIAEHIKK